MRSLQKVAMSSIGLMFGTGIFPKEKRWGKSKQNESVRINGHGKLTKSISLHTKEAA